MGWGLVAVLLDRSGHARTGVNPAQGQVGVIVGAIVVYECDGGDGVVSVEYPQVAPMPVQVYR